VLPASLTLGIVPGAEDNSGKVPSTAWVRSLVTTTGNSLVPTSRSITINGTSYDLSSNRSWSIDTGVLTASAGLGISVSVVNQNLNIVNTGLLTGTAGAGISVTTVNQNLNIVNTGLLTASSGVGISVTTVNQNLNIVNTGLLTATSGLGISVTTVNQNLNIVNTGLLTASSGAGISVTTVGQNLNIVNTGILTATAGAGISLSVVSGNLNIVNTITNNNQLDNGAGYATTSYVTTQINNLVDAAPGTLDTLNELAAALGDDPNFATTIAASIGTKQAQLNGTGFVKVTGTTVSYDNSTYLTTGAAASTYVSLTGSYSNPSWITALGWGKITGTPTTISGYGITNAYTDAQIQNFFNGANAITGYNKSNWDTAYGWGNHASVGYLTGITSSQVTTALGYTPYNSSNPSGYITSAALSSYLPLSGGTVSGPLTINTTSDIIANGDTFRMKGGGGSAEFIWYRNYSGDPSHPGFVIINRSGTTTFSHNSNGGGTSISGNFSAANFSGSSSGTNTGDQTLSGLGGVPTSGYAFGTSFTLGTMYVGTGEQFTPTTLLGVYSNGYAYKFPVAGVQAWLGLGSLAYSSATIPTNNNQLTNGAGYITGYSETDTLSSVTGRGATTSSPITINGGGAQPLALTTANGSPWHIALVRNDLGLTSRVFAHNSPYNGWYFEHNISIAGSTNWHSGNLTNLNQLSNGPGYITSSGSISGNAATATSAGTVTGSSTINGYLTLATNWAVSPYTSALTIIGTHPSMTFRGSNGDTHYLIHMDSNGDMQYYFGPGHTTNNWTRRYEFTKSGNFNVVTGNISASGTVTGSNLSGTNTGDQTNISGNAGTVTINYNNDSNSTYQLLWGSGNSVYGTAQVYVNPSSDIIYARGGYISPGNAWGTSDSAFFPNGITTAGGTNWIYGLTFIGNAPGNGAGHEFYTSGSSYSTGNMEAGSSMRAPIFYDRNDTTYYGDFASTSRIRSLNMGYVGGQVYLNSDGGTLFFNANGESDIQGYSIGTTMENYGGNYTKLTIDWHTGIRIGAASGYGGIRFYNNSVKYYGGSQVFSVAEGDSNVRVSNTLFVNGDVRSPIYYDSNDTAYYLNPAGGSRLRNLYVGDSGDDWSDPGGWGTQVRFSNGPHVRFVLHARSPGIEAGMYVHTPGSVFIGSYTGHDVSMMWAGSRRIHITGSYVYTDVYLEAAGSMRAPIFYDSNDTGYYLDPNSNSNLWKFTAGTMARNDMNPLSVNSPWSTRASQAGPYINGTMGWGQVDLNTIGSYWGSGFIDTWSSPGNAPGGSSHYVGMQAMHYNDQNGNFHGWQMVCAQEASNRWFWRSSWNVPNRPWVEMIHSGNIGSQTVSNSDMVDGYHASNFLGYNGNSYYQVNTWLQMNGTHGIYWPSYYGLHLYANTTSTYTPLRMDGQKNSYDGVWLSYSAVNGMMYDGGGNGGVYREANGRWYWYHHVGNNCTGISTSSTSSSYRAYIGGALYAEGDIVAYSDVRKKTDIVTIDNALEKVINLRGVYYTRIDDVARGRQTGVIAQEINEVLPEVVTYAADVDEYGVSYGNIVGVLIEAIKEQQLQIEKLQNKLDNVLSSR
jgi:uncharacterized protein YfkK (UPF0435 family)